MATLRILPGALEDLARLSAFLRESDPSAASETTSLILDGLKVLAAHPLIGRPLDANRRELVIFRGRTGYLAQYSYRAREDEVLILAVRHQRELDG
ncbi:MAG: type II toxin-antitoxin system RelE/ParE family toxin [Usitatibacter sp.]